MQSHIDNVKSLLRTSFVYLASFDSCCGILQSKNRKIDCRQFSLLNCEANSLTTGYFICFIDAFSRDIGAVDFFLMFTLHMRIKEKFYSFAYSPRTGDGKPADRFISDGLCAGEPLPVCHSKRNG